MNIIPTAQINGKTPVSILDFTNDQKIAYNSLIEFINSDYNENDYKRALIGPAGTGKTYLVKALIKNCNLSYYVIGLAAPTHKACRVLAESIQLSHVKINTLQSDLGLKINFDVEKFDITNPPFDPKGRIKIGDYQVYIVDEASMINRGLTMFLEKTCKSNKCKIIYIGDGSQLCPINENYSSAFKNIKSYKLNQIVRQEEDNAISYLLKLLRYDIEHKSFTFLEYISRNREHFDSNNTKGYKVCSTKEFETIVYNNFNDEELTRNIDFAKIIAYTNTAVSNWNKFIRNIVIKNADKSVITKNDLIISYITIVDNFNSPIIKNSEEYIIKDIVNYTHPTYELKGFLVRFQAIHGGQITSPLFILDHKDIHTMQQYVNISNSMIESAKSASTNTRSQKWRDYYAFKEGCLLLTNIINKNNKLLYSRDLDYGFALTSHKSQGSTFDTSLVDVNDIVYDRFGHPYANIEEINRRLYVACSRTKSKLYLKYG
ncbi:MAG: AAA family ATPase [Acholeplasmatales bacterium]|nr:AAA family ATPase [Methanobrevibacter sp.]MBP5444851.1 AAA family ATPase [Acholeplasmatales bacterium]